MVDETELGVVIERLDRLAEVLGTKGIETAKNAGEVQDPMSVHVMNVMVNDYQLAYHQTLADAQAKNIIQNAMLARMTGSEVPKTTK